MKYAMIALILMIGSAQAHEPIPFGYRMPSVYTFTPYGTIPQVKPWAYVFNDPQPFVYTIPVGQAPIRSYQAKPFVVAPGAMRYSWEK
jgi:hypothetical protein